MAFVFDRTGLPRYNGQMKINDTSIVEARTTLSPSIESRANSSIGSPASPQLQVFNPEDKAAQATNSANQKETQAKLHVVSQQGDRTPAPIKTIAQAQKESTLTVGSLMSVVRSILSLASAGLSATAMAAVTVLPKDSRLRKFIETWASCLARVSIGIVSGVTGAVDAIKDGKPGLAIAQIGDVVTSLVAPIVDMTNYRGLPIGMYNALPALETMHGKVQYDSVSDYFKTNWGACKQMFTKLKANPLILFDPSQKGAIGFWSGAAMSVTSLLYMLTGAKIFATARNALGISVEAEKAKPLHLREGRGRYAASGYLMMGGSAANIASQYTKSGSAFWSYANLLMNALGKERFNAALQANEPAKIGAPITFGQMVTNTVKNMFSLGREADKVLQKAQPVILKMKDQSEQVQVEVQKQVQAMNGNQKPLNTFIYTMSKL